MCEITVVNTGNIELNKLIFLLTGTFGSFEHKDGWGFALPNGDNWKCHLPMNYTSNSGFILHDKFEDYAGPFLGHIRRASPKVPVERKNSHPFSLDGITFVHNGKLTPKEEKDFVLEEEVKEVDKDGKEKITKVAISDSLLFFEKFVEIWKTKFTEKQDERFVHSLSETMNLFYGTFAMVFVVEGVYYIVRGKTKKLYISHFRETVEQDSSVIGWAINTSDTTLKSALVLASNLEQLNGRQALHYDSATLLPDEKILKVDGLSVTEIGEIKENYAPSKSANSYDYGNAWQGGSSSRGENFTKTTSGKITTEFQKYVREIFDFMMEYSLHPSDIQVIFWVCYGISLKQINTDVLKHFTKRMIPLFANNTNKKNKKELKRVLHNLPYRWYRYEKGSNYPWMLNSKNDQPKLIKKLSESK